jgi:uncharacterized membrane protein YgaE (UPF0421/DUF939 family)
MSSASLAKKRRANISQTNNMPPPVQPPQSTANASRNVPLTLPQVLQMIDGRLLKLEKGMKEQQEVQSENVSVVREKEEDDSLNKILAEYDARFQMLAAEIHDMKEIVLKLQSYTMDVNKTLLEERVQIMNLNTISTSDKETIEMVETTPQPIISETEFEFDENGTSVEELKEESQEVSVEECSQDVEMENGEGRKGKRRGKR